MDLSSFVDMARLLVLGGFVLPSSVCCHIWKYSFVIGVDGAEPGLGQQITNMRSGSSSLMSELHLVVPSGRPRAALAMQRCFCAWWRMRISHTISPSLMGSTRSFLSR